MTITSSSPSSSMAMLTVAGLALSLIWGSGCSRRDRFGTIDDDDEVVDPIGDEGEQDDVIVDPVPEVDLPPVVFSTASRPIQIETTATNSSNVNKYIFQYAGNRLSNYRVEADGQGDNGSISVDNTISFTYDEGGRVISITADIDQDTGGEVTRSIDEYLVNYDEESGQIVEIVGQSPGTRTRSYQYTDEGQIEWVYDSINSGPGSENIEAARYVYDASQRPEREELGSIVNNNFEIRDTNSFIYSGNSLVQYGNPVETFEFGYTADGVLNNARLIASVSAGIGGDVGGAFGDVLGGVIGGILGEDPVVNTDYSYSPKGELDSLEIILQLGPQQSDDSIFTYYTHEAQTYEGPVVVDVFGSVFTGRFDTAGKLIAPWRYPLTFTEIDSLVSP